jgi:cation diffusion facilitator family transporter
MNRSSTIVRTSVIGIVANVFLAGFKAAVGAVTNSIAIVMDAVNNLSDALSSLITIIGTKLAGKQPDRKHPLGYGRVEYISASVISVIVLYAGVSSLVESVKKIVHPEVADYSAVALFIIAVAVVVKIVLGMYVQRTGKQVNSDALVASGKDAMFDSIISASTLLAAFIYIFFGVSLEAWLGAIISLVIVKSGIDMLRDTVGQILGARADADLTRSIKKTILSYPEVLGVYDLVLSSYGPETTLGSVHLELASDMTVGELDDLEYRIALQIYQDFNVVLAGISVYSIDQTNPELVSLSANIHEVVEAFDEVLNTHGIHLDQKNRVIRFDVVINFDVKDREAVYQAIVQRVQELYPDYTLNVILDSDVSD